MRFPLLTVLGVVACAFGALPATAAQTPRAAWEERISVLSQVRANAALCTVIGYTIDAEGTVDAFMKAVADAPKAGVTATEAQTFAMTRMTMTLAEAEPYTANFTHPDEDVAYKAVNTAFSYGSPLCKRLSETSPYVKPGPFPASGRPQTFENYTLFQAETGSAKDMMTAVNYYETGYFSDPDYSKRVAMTRRAAEKRYPEAAMYMASYYVAGQGVETSFEKALMWAIIGGALGDPVSARAIPSFKTKVTPTQVARAEADAQAWLKAH